MPLTVLKDNCFDIVEAVNETEQIRNRSQTRCQRQRLISIICLELAAATSSETKRNETKGYRVAFDGFACQRQLNGSEKDMDQRGLAFSRNAIPLRQKLKSLTNIK